MINVIIAIVVIAILAAAIVYIVKAKKSGVKCIGCPAAGTCSQNHDFRTDCGCGSDCSCHSVSKTKKESPASNMALGNVCAAKINNAERK